MAERSIFVELGLRAENFKREAASAADALGKVGDAGAKSSQQSARGFKGLGKELQANRADIQTVGTGLLGVGAAMLGVTTAVAKTGLEYNILQQNSRAALTTLLGGAEAANAQMDKLDEFARTSPFSKATFIEAQRQMIGFGVETSKVIPYLDAIQNATAAIGGGNAEIAQIVDVFAKIQSQGKITARELMQLGIHGIDAATLIGEAMGKTGNQIREEITAGTLDADTALDALAEGMQGRFGGAAEGIKEQFTGALDRVKAAFRDFSASAMSEFVDPEGGGWLVGWTNSLADGIRQLDKLPQAAKTAGVVIGGVGGAAATAAGSFLLLAPRIVDTVDAMQRLKASEGILGGTARAVGGMGKAVGVLTVALAALKGGDLLMGMFRAAEPEIEKTTAALLGVKTGATGLDDLFAQIGEETMVASLGLSNVNDMASAMSALISPNFFERMNDFAATVMSLGGRAGRPERDAIIKQFDAMGESLANMVLSGHGERAAEIFAGIEQQWLAAGGSLEDLNDLMPAYGAALDAVANDAELAADGQDALADSTEEAAAAAADAQDSYIAYLDALSALKSFQDGMVDSFLKGRDAQRELTEATEEFGQVTEMTDEIMDGYAGTVRSSIQDMAQARDANGDLVWSTEELQGMMQSAREAIIDAAIAMGHSKGEAELLADSYGLVPELVETWVELHDAQARIAVEEIDAALGGLPEETLTTILAYGDQAVDVAAAVQSAIEDGVPVEWLTDLLADDYASAEADRARLTIEMIHRKWNTRITADDESSAKSQTAKSNVESIPQKWESRLSAIDNASGTADRIRNAIYSIPLFRTTTVTTRYTTSGDTSGGRQVRAAGGPVFGPGTETSDSIPVWMSHNEHVLTAAEVRAAGGHGNVFALRSMMKTGELARLMGFAEGGSPAARPIQVPASVAGSSVTVVINDYSTVNSPVQVPETVARAEQLQKVGALVGGLV